MHDRYQVAHEFLTPETGWEVVTIGRLVNAFFRWEFNSCETLVADGDVYPIDYANASPDVSLTSLHYYFPWAMRTLLKWCAFCTVTGRPCARQSGGASLLRVRRPRRPRLRGEARGAYRALAEEYFQTEADEGFCAKALPHVDELVVEYVESAEFDRLLVGTITSTFPRREHEQFVAHYRGLLAPWARDQRTAASGGAPAAPAHETA